MVVVTVVTAGTVQKNLPRLTGRDGQNGPENIEAGNTEIAESQGITSQLFEWQKNVMRLIIEHYFDCCGHMPLLATCLSWPHAIIRLMLQGQA